MTQSRRNLQAQLVSILGTNNVYFQPPESIKLNYPAIVYELSRLIYDHADNCVYSVGTAYSVTLIHKDPDNDIFEKLKMLPKTTFDRHFRSDNLNHYVFTIFS